MAMKRAGIHIGIEHKKHGYVHVVADGDENAIAWLATTLQRRIVDEAHGAAPIDIIDALRQVGEYGKADPRDALR